MSKGRIIADGTPAKVFPNVEALHDEGLASPDTTELLWQLYQAGMDVPLDALSVADCARAIAKALEKQQG